MKKNNIVRCCIVSSSVLSTCLYNCACGCSNPDPSNPQSYIVKALGIKESDILKKVEIDFKNLSVSNPIADSTEFANYAKNKDCFFVLYIYGKENTGGQDDIKISIFAIKGDLNKLNIDSSVIREAKEDDLKIEELVKKKQYILLYVYKNLVDIMNLMVSINSGKFNPTSGGKCYTSV